MVKIISRQHSAMNTGLDNANLSYEVFLKPKNFYTNLLKRLRDNNGSTIIYRSNHHAVESLTRKLQEDNISAVSYHSGLSTNKQSLNHAQFSNNQAQVIVTTGFFGRDIFKPDIRVVIHYDSPKSIYHYLQETKKAGKDGEPAYCILFASYQDLRTIVNTTERKYDLNPNEKEKIYTDLQHVSDYITSTNCRLSFLTNQPEERCGKCDNCSDALPEVDWTINTQKFLSCIARFEKQGRNFGASYTIEVLRGSNNEKIFRYKHHELSTYGIGKDKAVDYWRALSQFLLFHGLVEEIQIDDYSILKLNDKSWEIMRGTSNVIVQSKTWVTGEQKNPTHREKRLHTLELYRQGLSVSEIASKHGYQEQTILRHLANAIAEGESIDITKFVSRNGQIEISNAFKSIGTDPLKPVYEYLDERYDYGQISLVLAQWKKFGAPIQEVNNIDEGESYDGEYDYEEALLNYLPEYDTSLDLGYLEDIANPNAY
jgi:superfamily II DNA helicase RecQ